MLVPRVRFDKAGTKWLVLRFCQTAKNLRTVIDSVEWRRYGEPIDYNAYQANIAKQWAGS